jgi:hypothetical protein
LLSQTAKALTDMGDSSGQEMLVDVLAGERKGAAGIMTNARRTAEHKLKHSGGLVLMGMTDAAGSIMPPAGMGMMAAEDAAALRGKGAPGRVAAAAYVAKEPGPYAVKLLEWELSDDNHLVRTQAAKGLGERGNAGSVAKLQAAAARQSQFSPHHGCGVDYPPQRETIIRLSLHARVVLIWGAERFDDHRCSAGN